MNAPLVLMYNLDGKKGGALRVLCLKLNIRTRVVAPESFSQPVGALVGLVPESPEVSSPQEPFREEMLVLVNFGDKLLNALLQGMRAARIFIPLKAVLTPSNAQWSSIALHAELAREHATMHSGGSAP